MSIVKLINKSIGNPEVVLEDDKEILAKILEEERIREENQKSLIDELEPEKKKILIKKVIDNSSKYSFAKTFIENIPLYYDREGLWWGWNQTRRCWEIIDEVDILNLVKQVSFQNIIKSNERTELINALRQYARENQPEEAKDSWIQFDNEILDYRTGERFEADSKYFVKNPIPWKLGKTTDTPTLDRLFKEWVGEKYVDTLYEELAFLLARKYFLQRMFVHLGPGANGKGVFQAIQRKFVGDKNCVSTSLHLLINSRFETAKLRDKLLCTIAETDFNLLNSTQLIKSLVSGNDTIPIEYKNKGHLDYVNYAKVFISTNNLPETSDKTIGFYRRWLIIDFPNQFNENRDVLSEIPEVEFNNLALKCIEILLKLERTRKFSNEGTYEERQKRYEDRSNPFDKFLKEMVIEDYNSFTTKNQFKLKLTQWCNENKFRELSDSTIAKHMKDKGITEGRPYMKWFEDGISTEKQVRAWMGIKLIGGEQ